MNTAYRLTQLRRWTEQHPEEAAQYLAVVAEGLEGFRQRAVQHRNMQAYNAVTSLCAVSHPIKYALGLSVYLLDAVLFACPRGREANAAPAVYDLWNLFIEFLRRDAERGHGFKRSWMQSTRPEAVAWFEEYVTPFGVTWAPEDSDRG